jgi:DsbC/DsbD-like thiol-disulfide interchange protein
MNFWPNHKLSKLWHGLLILFPLTATAQSHSVVEYAGKRQVIVKAGSEETLALTFTIKEGFYIQANKPDNDSFIPTQIHVQPSEGIIVGIIQYPKAALYRYDDEGTVLKIYRKEITIIIPIYVNKDINHVAEGQLSGFLYYQACSGSKCFYPRKLEFTLKVVYEK